MCEYGKGIHTRKEREWTENCRIHVMARGIRKMAIFKADEDYLIFMKILKCVQEKTPFELHGPLDCHYSSYQIYMNVESNSIVAKDYIMDCFGNDVEKYRMFVEGKMSHKEQELLIQKEIGEDERWLPW